MQRPGMVLKGRERLNDSGVRIGESTNARLCAFERSGPRKTINFISKARTARQSRKRIVIRQLGSSAGLVTGTLSPTEDTTARRFRRLAALPIRLCLHATAFAGFFRHPPESRDRLDRKS